MEQTCRRYFRARTRAKNAELLLPVCVFAGVLKIWLILDELLLSRGDVNGFWGVALFTDSELLKKG